MLTSEGSRFETRFSRRSVMNSTCCTLNRRQVAESPPLMWCGSCLTLRKKGVPVNICCDDVLRALGCEQDPCDIPEEKIEDPFPGPPPPIDFLQEKKRCRKGVWMKPESSHQTELGR
ncbi:hypothetical protein AVEN_184919-1 [Araneus ventricosus]|uniref:Uncharacterized protein n=1 Tax=Araneus ventricosus TaxID=182803 RepID=A0A4Y2PYD4_ARAVE|nr:hypothetical protein AVEN_184919-1 [Araneus ventricosus]